MKAIISFIMMLMVSLTVAQSGSTISGKVIDENGKAIDLALVSLHSKLDSSIIKAEYTDVDGSFQLTNVADGRYRLAASMLSYRDYGQLIEVKSQNITLEPIALELTSESLDQVTVTATVPFVERKIDRVVINPDALISAAGNNALEVLEKAPGITLNSDGTILLKGRSGVSIFINDKPSYLSGSELESYLSSLPAGSVKRIEIMVNPPARYEAAGNSGVINIVMKRDKRAGFFGNLNAAIKQGKYTSSNNGLNLNYNRKKLSLFANIYGGFSESYQDLYINRFYRDEQNNPTTNFSQNSYNYRDGEYLNAKIGVDYYLSERTTLGISYKNNNNPSGRDTDNIAFVTNPQDVKLQRVVADNVQENSFNNEVVGVYVTQKLDTSGTMITFDADYVNYATGSDQTYKNFIYNQEDVLTFSDQINGDIPSTIKIYAAKTDFTKPINAASRFEAGLKTARTETDNEAIYSTTIDNVTTPDYDLSNRFLYDERIHAAYLNYATSFGRVDVQAGLRGEATTLEGNQLGNVEKPDSSFKRSYENLFPTLYATWKVDSMSNHLLSFAYSRRINRPYFMDLNPFISPLDKFTFYSGNPNLLPTFSNNFSLSHTWKNMITSTLSYAKTTNGINETLEIREGIYYSRPGNIADDATYSLSFNGSFNINKWYSLNAYLELGYKTFDSPLYTEQLASSGDYQHYSINNAFRLGKGWKISLSGFYRSDLVYSQLLLKSFGRINWGLQKSLFDGKANVKLAVDDVLYTIRGNGVINNLRLTDANWNSTRDTRRVAVAFSMKFGKSDFAKKKYKGSGSDSEQRRVRG